MNPILFFVFLISALLLRSQAKYGNAYGRSNLRHCKVPLRRNPRPAPIEGVYDKRRVRPAPVYSGKGPIIRPPQPERQGEVYDSRKLPKPTRTPTPQSWSPALTMGTQRPSTRIPTCSAPSTLSSAPSTRIPTSSAPWTQSSAPSTLPTHNPSPSPTKEPTRAPSVQQQSESGLTGTGGKSVPIGENQQLLAMTIALVVVSAAAVAFAIWMIRARWLSNGASTGSSTGELFGPTLAAEPGPVWNRVVAVAQDQSQQDQSQ